MMAERLCGKKSQNPDRTHHRSPTQSDWRMKSEELKNDTNNPLTLDNKSSKMTNESGDN